MTASASTASSTLAALLPGMSAVASSASRLLHDERMARAWSLLGEAPGSVAVAVADRGAEPLYDVTLHCDAGSLRLALAASDGAIAMLAATPADTGLRATALQALFETHFERVSAGLLPGLRAVQVQPMPAADAPLRGWCAMRRAGREWARCAVVDMSHGVVDALLSARAGASRAARRTTLQLVATLEIGERPIDIATLRSLEVGDVLLLPSHASAGKAEGMPATLRLGSAASSAPCAAGHVVGTTFTFLGDFKMTIGDTACADEQGLLASAIDNLEVAVRFELESVSIPLADLEAIAPGYVIELGMPVSDARLRLISCGVLIGEAELVAVAGQLGARIVNLVPRQ